MPWMIRLYDKQDTLVLEMPKIASYPEDAQCYI